MNQFISRRLNLRLTLGVILLFSVIAGCFSGNSANIVFTGTVTKVHDGDSIHITPLGEKRIVIRLAAIDAPETTQDHGIESRDHLRNLIMNKQVTAKCNKLDKYQRQLCVVLLSGHDTNLEMLKAGQAWYYERFRDEQSRSDQKSYIRAAAKARKQKLGIWQNDNAIPPWEFRSKKQN